MTLTPPPRPPSLERQVARGSARRRAAERLGRIRYGAGALAGAASGAALGVTAWLDAWLPALQPRPPIGLAAVARFGILGAAAGAVLGLVGAAALRVLSRAWLGIVQRRAA